MSRYPHRRGRLWARLANVFVGLVILVLLAIGAAWWFTLPASPDGFYARPAVLPAEPGRLLRTDMLARGIPAEARAWRMLYTTRRADGSPAVASAIVMLPLAGSLRPPSIIAWAHGTTGVAPGCAPSLQPRPLDGMPGVPELLRQGWAVVATDYVGLGTAGGHAYLVGEEAAHAVLDAVRAALADGQWRLDERVIIWGHSQGGHSALWAGIRAASYAPELRVQGVAAMAPASDLVALLDAGRATEFGKLVSAFALAGYRRAYSDVDGSYVRPMAGLLAADIAQRCITDRKALWSIMEVKALPAEGLFIRAAATGPFGERLRQNTPAGMIAAPLLIAQGMADEAVRPEIQRRYVAARCAAGQAVDYREYAGRDHMGVVGAGSPMVAELIAWTRDRLEGRPAASTCPR